MIQGARAAYARLPRDVFLAGRIQAGLRRNLAPILGDGEFLCCASPLHGASPHNLVWPEAIRGCVYACASRISLNG